MSFSEQIEHLLQSPTPKVRQFISLLEEQDTSLEELAVKSVQLTRQNFGQTIRLFAPLYLSNECVNNCQYCGFSRDNPILRTTLSIEQVVQEARYLHGRGFRHILLVAGEHPKFVNEGYLQDCIKALRDWIPSLGIEVGPMEDEQYQELVECGAEGLTVYQETYHQETYQRLHTAGPKKKYHWRLDCPERAYQGGFRRIGIGALFGLASWKEEAVALATHLDYLQRHCWKASYTVSFPRMRPHAGNYEYQPDPRLSLSNRDLVRTMLAVRICFPQVGIVLSTREEAMLRNRLFKLGVTHISAESQTNPGGYTGAATDDLHLTIKGRRVELDEQDEQNVANAVQGKSCQATGQFNIDDHRSAEEITRELKLQGLDPVWKDWDPHILSPSLEHPFKKNN